MAYNTPFTEDAVDGSITVGAEDDENDVRAITVQLKDATGTNMDERTVVDLLLFANSGGTDYAATGGSTGIAAGAEGKILAALAKKWFKAITDATGKLTLTWTDDAGEVAYLGVKLPNGKIIMSGALTNVVNPP